ncbi:transposable element Tc1 transposase [Trichonephila clavipes]|nr:transposable element Tc1 transposase [Trichonephila clavipes]
MWPLEDADKNGWTVTNFSVMMRPIYSSTVRRRHSENYFATVPFAVPWPYFSEDNARQHAARVAMNCLTACLTLPWPSRSPDLSSIEPVWDMMGSRLHLPWNVDILVQ